MNNTRFATAIHILTLLAHDRERWLSSDYIAGSININPVVVRKEIGTLQQAGLVVSRKGKEGGSQLARSGEKITLAEIYFAVKNSDVLGKKNLNTSVMCPVGAQINSRLEALFGDVDEVVANLLRHKTLADFLQGFR